MEWANDSRACMLHSYKKAFQKSFFASPYLALSRSSHIVMYAHGITLQKGEKLTSQHIADKQIEKCPYMHIL